ncbi:hypothetical protein BKA66DRAFT_423131 [Pyrenochaeta sp. MPI-SDFR-AT-0127]|nr:hypothetical protein BKA66DRAFT_423131 [Pyrenochaeta sp. MPI-SDFR-AT-0127]
MVYITSDLFGLTTTHDREHTSMTTLWPTMASSQHMAGLGKRKRHDADEGPSMHDSLPDPYERRMPDHISNKHQIQHWPPPSARESTRSHTLDPLPFERHNNLSYALLLPTTNKTLTDRRPPKQLKRLGSRAMLIKSTSHLMDVESDLPSMCQQSHSTAHVATDLRPCHACNLAPKRNRDLVNYLDCRRCDGRTCYICARECVQGCGGAICKKCIVEVGQEGDSWCLDCYSKHINS